MPDTDSSDYAPIELERLDRIMQRRAHIRPPHTRESLESAEAATTLRDEYAASMWERYRQQAMDGLLRVLRDQAHEIRTAASFNLSSARWRAQTVPELETKIQLLRCLAKMHGETTTGHELSALFPSVPPKDEDALRAFAPELLPGSGTLVLGVALEKTEIGCDIDASNLAITIGVKETLAELIQKQSRRRDDLVREEVELREMHEARQCHAHLIGVLIEEYEVEGEVLPWFIGQSGLERPAAAEPPEAERPEAEHSENPGAERAALLASAASFHEHVRTLRDSMTLEEAYKRTAEIAGGTRWKNYDSFKSAHNSHWRRQKRKRRS